MSYRIYRTEALVLRSRPHAEADRLLTLYTQDFGLIYARAQGVRYEKSKLRYALTDYTHASVALVRGKGGWRLTGAVSVSKGGFSKKGLIALARISLLITRLVHGEEQNEYLFGTLASARAQLEGGADAELIEVISVSRILHALGYVAPTALDGQLFTEGAYDPQSLARSREAMPTLVKRINETLAVTQL